MTSQDERNRAATRLVDRMATMPRHPRYKHECGHEGGRFTSRLILDEILGPLAAMTIPTRAARPSGLAEPVLDSLRAFVRDAGARGASDADELVPWYGQDDLRVRFAMLLLDAVRAKDSNVVDAEVGPGHAHG